MDSLRCERCKNKNDPGFGFTMAFQPIVDLNSRSVFGYEALVRGLDNQSAASIIAQLNQDNIYQFDQNCRVKAIQLAAQLHLQGILSINFLPNAIYQPERCIRTTLDAARTYDFPVQNIMFEFTEAEKINDTSHIKNIVDCYHQLGFITALDDFGSGYSGLNLLADFQTNIVKLDMHLIRSVDCHAAKQAIINGILQMMAELGIQVLAEGVETRDEAHWLQRHGISLMQGFLFAKPRLEQLPDADFSHFN
nr:EAL domain-containing protein [Vibrio aerogenes]